MWLCSNDVLVAQEFNLVFYLCLAAVGVICFAIAIKLIGNYKGD